MVSLNSILLEGDLILTTNKDMFDNVIEEKLYLANEDTSIVVVFSKKQKKTALGNSVLKKNVMEAFENSKKNCLKVRIVGKLLGSITSNKLYAEHVEFKPHQF